MDLKELVETGERMGLAGKDLMDFVKDQQSADRDARAQLRDEEKLEKERERAEREVERAHQLEIARLNAQAAENSRSNNAECERPRIPTYDDKEDFSSFIIRFERVCKLTEVPEDSYAVRLGSSLRGKAAELYSSLSPEITEDYNNLKKAMLMGFNKTAESYRLEFRSAKRTDETYLQFSQTLRRKLEFWLAAAEVPRTLSELVNFFILDQFMASLPTELRTFLKEKGKLSITDAANAADNWSIAHPIKQRPKFSNNYSNAFVDPNKVYQESKSKPNTNTNTNNNSNNNSRSHDNLTCHNCGVIGHIRTNCPGIFQSKPNKNFAKTSNPNVNKVSMSFSKTIPDKFMCQGTVNGFNVSTIVRDTGCGCVVVSQEVMKDVDVAKCEKTKLEDYLGRINEFPVVKCYLKCIFFDGWVDCVVAPLKCCAVLVGNIVGVKDCKCIDSEHHNVAEPTVDTASKVKVAAITRSKSASHDVIHPLKLPLPSALELTPDEFKTKQKQCPTLQKYWRKAIEGEISTLKDGSKFSFIIEKDLLYRKCISSNNPIIVGRMSLVLPLVCREMVLKLAHECPVAGHFSHTKTYSKISTNFFWPGASYDCRAFCRSCDLCQKMTPKKVPPVQLTKMPIITEPFSRISMDIIGPLSPTSAQGHKYVLTVIDWATGFPEAVPLKRIDSISVAEALLEIFSRVGVPREILSDQASNFTSKLMGELHKLFGIKPLFSSIYHAQGNGRIERLHLTLKNCLRKLCADKPREWNRYLVATLFAIRELPSNRSGFSPFELLYGRQVRGPISVLKDLWTNPDISDNQRDVYQYVVDLKDKLESCSKLAFTNSKLSQEKFSTYFDLKAKDRSLEINDEALVLLPDTANKLLVCWKGPYRVIKKLNKVNYILDVDGVLKTFHINLLKKYARRTDTLSSNIDEDKNVARHIVPHNIFFLSHATVIDEPSLYNSEKKNYISLPNDLTIDYCDTKPNHDCKPEISNNLSSENIKDINNIIQEYSDVFSNLPGHTNTVDHKIELNCSEPVISKVYPVPVHLRTHFDTEVNDLLKQGIIERSISSYRSPVVLVKKPDNSYRMTVDYRQLNSFTHFDAEPAFNIDDDIHKMSGCVYFSDFDICNAYYQIDLDKASRHLTAFPTGKGLMQWTRLPLGLSTACQTYARLMRIVLEGLDHTTYYFDNILVFTKTWQEHVIALKSVLDRLRQHGLTAKPTKCHFGFHSIEYLGINISGDSISPIHDKVKHLNDIINPPTTKKCLRSFLGFLSFYRKFIPNLANITAPLNDLIKLKSPELLSYNEEQLDSFNKSKQILLKTPILKLPNLTLPFVLRTDASATGLGAVLLQYHDGVPYPVSYASRRLASNEQKFSTVERECLAIIFATQKFSNFLLGAKFLLEVDHRPLVYLNKMKNMNGRLARWSLCLQPFSFSIVHLSGIHNIGADYLSRCS